MNVQYLAPCKLVVKVVLNISVSTANVYDYVIQSFSIHCEPSSKSILNLGKGSFGYSNVIVRMTLFPLIIHFA